MTNLAEPVLWLTGDEIDNLVALLAEAASVLREEHGDLATRLLLVHDDLQGDFDAEFLAESGQAVNYIRR